MSPFREKVIQVVRMIPYGKVASYGQVGLYCGLPRAAREVGWILNGTEGNVDLPWWRVINNKGLITIGGTKYSDREVQRKLLQAEGVAVQDDFSLDIEKYRFQLVEKDLKKLQLSDAYIRVIIGKYDI